MAINNKAERYIAQQIFEQADEYLKNPEWNKKIKYERLIDLFIKKKYKDFFLDKVFTQENSELWREVSEEVKRTTDPSNDFTQKIAKGTKIFLEDAGYIHKEEKFDRDKVYFIKEKIGKDMKEYDRRKKETTTNSDFDYMVRQALIENMETCIKKSLMETKRLNPKYFGTNKEYANEYDFFLEEKSDLFLKMKKVAVFKEPFTEEEKAEALKLITRTTAKEYIDSLFKEPEMSVEDLKKATEELKAANEQFFLIRMERLSFNIRPDNILEFNGESDDMRRALPYIKEMKTYGYNFDELETRLENTLDDSRTLKYLTSFLQEGGTKVKLLETEKEPLLAFAEEIEIEKKGLVLKNKTMTYDAITCEEENFKKLINDLKEVWHNSGRNQPVGFSGGNKRPQIALTKNGFVLNEEFELTKLSKKIDVICKTFKSLNSVPGKYRDDYEYKKTEHNIKMKNSGGEKWEILFSSENSLKITGDPKICDKIIAELNKKENIKNIIYNETLIKGSITEEMKEKNANLQEENIEMNFIQAPIEEDGPPDEIFEEYLTHMKNSMENEDENANFFGGFFPEEFANDSPDIEKNSEEEPRENKNTKQGRIR